MANRAAQRAEMARNLYQSGYSEAEIAAKLGICRQTVYKYRDRDKKRGIDWDRLRMQQALGEKEFQEKHKVFLFALFDAFEKDLPQLQQIETPKERLDMLERYSNSYYKLMNAAKREQPEIAVAEIVGKTMDAMAEHAARQDRRDVLEWMMNNLEELKAVVIGKLR